MERVGCKNNNFRSQPAHEYNYKPGSTGNSREDAEKCLEISQAALNDGNLKRAEKFAAKAERMYKTRLGKELLEQIAEASGKGQRNTSSEGVGKKKYTKEQMDEIRRVKEAKDAYEVLGVPKDHTRNEVAKAFRRLSLVLHPDKNKADGAKEAFMTVTEAAHRLKSPKPITRVG